MKIFLDGNTYELDGGVQREAIPEWPQFQPDIGKRRREDRSYISSYAKESWSGGFGILKSLPEVDLDRFWDADAETRFPGQITPPILIVQDNITPIANLHSPEYYGPDYYAVTAGSGIAVGSLWAHYLYKYDPTIGWGSYGCIATMPAYPGTQLKSLGIKTSGDGAYLVSCCWTNTGSLSSFPTYPMALLWNRFQVGSLIGTYGGQVATIQPDRAKMSNLPGDTFASMSITASNRPTYTWEHKSYGEGLAGLGDIRATGEIRGIAPFSTVEGTYTKIWSFREGLFKDILAIGPRKTILDMKHLSGEFAGLGLNNWNRNLFIPVDRGILIYTPAAEVIAIGPEEDDGLTESKSGPITASALSLRYIFFGKSGNSIKKANIQIFDQLSWHSIWEDNVVNRYINDMLVSRVNNIDRLHFFVNVGTLLEIGGATLAYHLPYVLSNPITEASLSVATQGYFTDSQFQGYTPELPGGFYRVSIQGEGLGGANKITVCYGLNGAAPVTTLGQVSSSGQWLNFGTVGTQGNYIQMKYILERGTLAGTYPQFKMAVMEYIKNPPLRESWLFTINNNKTAKELQLSEEQVLSNIRTSQQKNTMIPFNYGAMGTRNVRVESALAQESVIENMPSFEAERKSLIQVRLVEML